MAYFIRQNYGGKMKLSKTIIIKISPVLHERLTMHLKSQNKNLSATVREYLLNLVWPDLTD